MNVLNVEIYSLVILFIMVGDYLIKFRNKINKASIIWLLLTFSTMITSISNICIESIDSYNLKVLFLIIYLISALLSSLFVYIYVKHIYMNVNVSLKKEAKNIALSILVCLLLSISYVLLFNIEYSFHVFNRSFFSQLLFLTIIPNIVIFIMYLHYSIKNKYPINIQIVFTLCITIIALIFDIINDSLFFVSATFTITSLIMYINKHDKLLNTDPLTGLANKRGLETFLSNLKSNLIVGVYSIDVDKFKLINDTYGHLKGDEILKNIALLLRDSSRNADIVIRNGGDEFLILAIIKKEKDVKKIVNRINSNVKVYNIDNLIKVGLSIGWGIYRSKEKNSLNEFSKTLKEIDLKMYKQKEKKHKMFNK